MSDQDLFQVMPRFVLALQAARLGVWEYDVATQHLVWDERMYELFGVSRTGFADPTEAVERCIHPSDLADYRAAVAAALDGKGSLAVEFRTLWPDQSVHYLKCYGEVMPDLDGHPRLLIGADYDISEQKLAELALQKSANRYRLLTESMKDVVWSLDPDQMTFTYISPSIVTLLGYPLEDILAQPFRLSMSDEDAWRLQANIQERVRSFGLEGESSQTFFTEEVQQRRRDGSLMWTEIVTNYAVNPESGCLEVRGVTRDISERKQTEARIRRQLTEIEVLYDIGLAISRLQEPRQICQKVLDLLAQEMDWHHATIRQYHAHENRLALLAVSEPGLKKEKEAERFDQLNRMISRPGEGLSGWALLHGASVLCPQVKVDPRYCDTYPGIQSGLYVPIKTNEQVLGVIAVESDKENAFSEQDERLLQTIASQTAIAFENNNLYSQLEQELVERKNAEEQLLKSNKLIQIRLQLSDYSANHTLKELLQLVLDMAEHLTQSKIGFMHFISEDQKTILLQTWSTNTLGGACHVDLLNEQYGKHEAGLWIDCVNARQTLVFNDYPNHPDKHGLPAGHVPVERFVTVPIMRNDLVKAVFGVGNKVGEYDSADVEAMNQLADAAWDISARKKAEEDLHKVLASLEQRVAERTAELKESEARLRQSRDDLATANIALEKAARLKDEFLASTSHELRTPLTGILGLSEALQTQTYGELNERQFKAVQNIENSGRHLLDLINEILDLSKIEAGKLEMQYEYCSLAELCQESLQLTRGIANKKNQSISFSINPVTLNINTDPRRLKQMLANLLGNAVKFTPEGGNIGLVVQGNPAQENVHITVWDEGIGIDPQDIPNLFQPFMQLDNSLKRNYPGTGLGLALVKRMTDLLKGSLQVESQPGQGSRFTIVLPWRVYDTQPVRYETSFTHIIRTSLYIEPNEVDGEHLTRSLRHLRVRNMVHPHVTSIQEVAQIHQPDIIFLELHYPGVFGFDVLKRLKADPHTEKIPVIVLSVEERRQEAQACGAAEFLVKPFTTNDVKVILERVAATMLPAPVNPEHKREQNKNLVYLVDDNEVVLNAMADYLEAQNYRVEKACCALDLLERAPGLHPDLILMDIQMPEFDGLDAIRRIRAHADPGFANTPVVALTALAMPGDRERCLEAGMNDYISKPIRLADLAARVHDILLQHKK